MAYATLKEVNAFESILEVVKEKTPDLTEGDYYFIVKFKKEKMGFRITELQIVED